VSTVFAPYSPSYPYPCHQPPGQDLFCSSIPDIVKVKREKIKRKTSHFCLFEIKVVTQGISM
jgi:hypothetical protein